VNKENEHRNQSLGELLHTASGIWLVDPICSTVSLKPESAQNSKGAV